jgi:hypothetical protein
MPEPQLLALSAADALAISMVALLSFALGMIVTIIFIMARSGSSATSVDTEIFEEEEEQSYNVEAGDQPKEAPREAWEQDPDWWKK